jgi:enediyne biosynthesis protein E5
MTIRSMKVQLGIFLILFALYLFFISKETVFLSIFGISLIFAIAADSFITYLKTKKLIITESSVVSGLIIGYVLSNSQAWWIIALASVLAIGSKHLIRFKSRHVFNPAGFGILMAVFLLGASTEWKGANLWYIIIPFGIYFSFKIRRLELIAGYFTASLILFGGQALIQKVNILDIFGYLNYFFIFIMLIEPMTTPAAYYGKIIFGAGIGTLIFILYLFGIKEAEILALLFFNLSAPLLNKRRGK